MRNDNLSSPDDDTSAANSDDDAAADTDAHGDAGSGEVPHAARRGEALIESASLGSGIGTIYRALDRVVDLYALDDAALVLDLPGLGRQVLHAGRKPLGNDERGILRSPPGLYLDPPLHDPALDDLMIAVGALGLRFDTNTMGVPERSEVVPS